MPSVGSRAGGLSAQEGAGGRGLWKSAEWLLGVMLVVAPVFYAFQPELAVLSLEFLAVLLLVLVLLKPRVAPVSRGQGLWLASLLALPLLYLIPLPEGLVAVLPGHGPYVEALGLMGEGGRASSMTLSLVPWATQAGWLLLWVPVAVFLCVRSLDSAARSRLVMLLFAAALLQSGIGLLQFLLHLSPLGSAALWSEGPRVAAGTYSNPNHFAGLLAMVFPLGLALAAYGVEQIGSHGRKQWREQPGLGNLVRRYPLVPFALIAMLLLAAILASRSWVGIGLSMLALMLWTLLLSNRARDRQALLGIPRSLLILTLGGVLLLVLVPLFDRVSLEDMVDDSRGSLLAGALSGIAAFFPLGSGPNTFTDVFPAFQPLDLGQWWIEHAHNDYLEWLFETGLFGAALIIVGLLLYARQWRRIGAPGDWPRLRFVQVGAGIGILLLLLFSALDSNLHIPANILYFAFLAGLFFSDPAERTETEPRRHRRRRTPDLVPQDLTPSRPGTRLKPVEQIPNPFLEE